MTRCDDDEFDRRLSLEIIPDAYGPEEQALSWYYYLEEHLQFPFEAECIGDRSTSPLRVGDRVDTGAKAAGPRWLEAWLASPGSISVIRAEPRCR